MHTYLIAAGTTLALLTGTALADHCAFDMAEAQSALSFADQAPVNAADAATALITSAAEACRQEEEQLASASFDSPMLAPDYVSVGQSMLINARALLSGH